MKFKITFLSMLVLATITLSAEFARNLPEEKLQKVLTPENFKNMDAVIILKEQSYTVHDAEYYYRGVELKGTSTTKNNIMLVKLFNEKAVERYGTFEFKYHESFGDEIPNYFNINVRVLKENGDVWTMPDDYVKPTVSRENSMGIPLARKVLLKIPDLGVGDILQLEYRFQDRFSKYTSAIFTYQERDFILYSNLYLTLPFTSTANFYSFPQDQIGQPEIVDQKQAAGAGKTYFWSLQNLRGINDEPLSLPFESQSLITAFVIDKWSPSDYPFANWERRGEEFYKDYIQKDNVSNGNLKKLGFDNSIQDSDKTYALTDSLYKALRQTIVLEDYNSIYPLSDEINSIFDKGKADASDMAYAMYKILDKWDIPSSIVWLRDKREGKFEKSVPTIRWFDRLAVLTNIGGQEKLYDFDSSIPFDYTLPWFDKSVEFVVIDKQGGTFHQLKDNIVSSNNITSETHNINWDENMNSQDQTSLILKGYAAEQFRTRYYDIERSDIESRLNNTFQKYCYSNIESLHLDNFLENQRINIELSGQSKSLGQKIDSLLTVKLHNHCLNSYIENFTAPIRFNHIDFKTPFQFMLKWNITIPENYKLVTALENKQIQGPGKMYSSFNFTQNENTLVITMNVKIEETLVHNKYYGEIHKFLQESLKAASIDLVVKQAS